MELIASGSADKVIKIWNFSKARESKTIFADESQVISVCSLGNLLLASEVVKEILKFIKYKIIKHLKLFTNFKKFLLYI